MLPPLPLGLLLAAPDIAMLLCLWPADLVAAMSPTLLLLLPLLPLPLLLLLLLSLWQALGFLTTEESILRVNSLGSL